MCPHCGHKGANFIQAREGSILPQSARRLWQCKSCRKQFSAMTGSIFHGSKVPLRKWLFVVFEMASNKNGMAAREIERKYGVAPKTAWFMAHRIREAMKTKARTRLFTGTVVSDETWIGGDPANKHHDKVARDEQGNMVHHTEKTPVLSLVDKQTGEVRSRVVPTSELREPAQSI